MNNSNAVGLVGAKLDPRINIETQSAADAKSDDLRVYWSSTTNRFYTTSEGDAPGIKRFFLDESLAEVDFGEQKQSYLFKYASEDSWIWDFEETRAPTRAAATLAVKTVPESTTPPDPVGPTNPGPEVISTLQPPEVSRESGTYSYAEFNQPVTLTNPNISGASDVFYSVDYANWQLYTAPFLVSPGSRVSAQAIAKTTNYESSPRVDKSYEAKIEQLRAPIISPDRTTFGFFFGRTINVTLIEPNDPGISVLEYRIGGDPWQSYEGEFKVNRSDYPSGVLIQARSVSLNPYYLSSTTSLRTLSLETAEIDGGSVGSFSDPTGESLLTTNLVTGQASDYFEWGRDYFTSSEINNWYYGNASSAPALDKAWLNYSGNSFESVSGGTRFEVGSLEYHNGTIVANTGATAIKLGVDLNLDIDGLAATTSFDFNLDLINVPNAFNSSDLWADADYVKLANPVADNTIVLNGVEFQFRIEFGETTSDGLSYFDEFYVLEGKEASTKVYGTLVEIGSLDFND
ncbi:MAG: choice-of-anchor K domain-containing protein [Verrucomicrobiales bacterium]|nr:choice-of-anchor K domain-containing protein [Verrucomicrobiales bacterium]